MTTQPFAQFEQHGPLARIQEGMAVHDSADNRIGTVREVYMGNSEGMGGCPW